MAAAGRRAGADQSAAQRPVAAGCGAARAAYPSLRG